MMGQMWDVLGKFKWFRKIARTNQTTHCGNKKSLSADWYQTFHSVLFYLVYHLIYNKTSNLILNSKKLICKLFSFSRLSFLVYHCKQLQSPVLYPDTLSHGLPISLHFLWTLTLAFCLFSLVLCPSHSVVVEMFCQGWPSGWWGGTFRVLVRHTISGNKLQGHFILITEWGSWALNVFLLCQLFSTARRCVRDHICPMEERVVHL